MDIPSRNLTEEALQLALDSADAGTWDWNVQTGELVWSKQCLAMFGLPANAEMSYEEFMRVVHPEDRDRIDRAVKIALETGADYAVEMRTIWPDGSIHWVASRGRVSFNEARQPVRMIGAGLDITKLKTTEESLWSSREELRRVKERFELALHSSPITVFTMDRDLRYKWIYNPRGGDRMEDLIGKRDSQVLERPEEAAGIERIKSEVLRTGQSYRGEMTAHFKGEPRTYHVSIDPTRDAQCQIIGLTCACFDFTEQKRAEDALRQQRARYDFVAEGSDVGFWFCDLPFDKIIWDKRVKNHFWLPPDDSPVNLKIFYSILHPDDREPTRLAVENSISNNVTCDVEYRTVAPDGRQKWIRAVGRAFYDANGNPVRFDGITQDITERKCTEEALRASEVRYRLLFETMTEGFALCELIRDHAGRAVDIRWLACNPALERLTGLSRDRVVGHCASEVFPDEYKWWVETYERVVRDKQVHRFEQGADSIGRVWDLTAFPYDGDRYAVLYDDITARKQAEDALRASEARYRELAENLDRQVQARTLELQQRNDQVMRASEDLRELSGRVLRVQDEERRRIARELHDSAGQILTALGLELGSLAEDIRRAAPQLADSIAGAEELVQQLHREIRTTSYLLHPPLLDEAGLSSALSWYLSGLGERSEIEIQLEIPEDFGRLPRDMELVMFRLVQESVTNIHRHSGSPVAKVRITRDSGAVTIEVRDQGKGMSGEELKKIREGGSGVGIRGMRERLRQFCGELQIESDKSGTLVLVRIPIPQSTAAEFAGEPLQRAV